MATILKLKLRDRGDSVTIPFQAVANWLKLDEETAKDRMYTFFQPLKGNDLQIHDKRFMEQTINWSPVVVTERGPVAKGLPLTEQLRWHRIGRELEEIPDDEEGILKLRSKDIDLIIERWKDKEFKLESIFQRPWIFDFLMEFQETMKRWISDDLEKDLEDESEEDPQLEEVKVPVSEDGDH